jgi:hypothetical protein
MADLRDQPGDPFQRPQFGAKTPSAGATQQGGLESVPVGGRKPRFASGSTSPLQPGSPAPPPRLIPAVSAGATDPQTTNHLGLPMALRKQLRGSQAADFQGREISPRPQRLFHARQSTTRGLRAVTLF